MKTFHGIRRLRAFTVLELLCVIAIIGLLAALLLPALRQARAHARRIQCVDHLRQLGIAFQSFAHDHNSQFPMAVPASAGGSLEFAQNAFLGSDQFYYSYHHFQVLSNDALTPRILVCPADTRQPAPDFASLKNDNLSYFIGLTATYDQPNSILAGDRNLTNFLGNAPSLTRFGPTSPLGWTHELHEFKGNLLYADGRVVEKNTPGLTADFTPFSSTASFALPSLPGGGNGPGPNGGAGPATARMPGSQSTSAPSSDSAPSSAGAPGAASAPAAPTVGSVPVARRVDSAASVPTASSALPAPPAKPSTNVFSGWPAPKEPEPDPGFSIFPEWMIAFVHGLVRKGSWILYILLALLAAVALVLRRLTRSKPLRQVDDDE